MNIIIHELSEQNIQVVNRFDNTFLINSKLILRVESGMISYEVVDVPPYEKIYPYDEIDPHSYLNNPERTIFFAYADNEPAGQIRLKKNWNEYAYIEDLVVDIHHRRLGIGRALVLRAIEWAGKKNFPGMMLETQNNNAAACRLYDSCGFEFGGFDQFLYKGLNPATEEVALYWYYFFK
ncbi:MAG TPA: GNAT family N-acetyltransferase [Anaerolineales bacterium]|nr:GNAT family N-acetyltransferase [Anaerolineales bacterium]